LRVFHRRAHVISIKESLLWTAFWIAVSLLFNLGIYLWQGSDTALEFLTCYLIEKSLSLDNLFVFLLIFSYFAVPALYQHKVLFWGILGAVVMRLAFILAGVTLIDKFHWVIYIFGAFLIITSVRMALRKETGIKPEKNPVLRLFCRLMPVTESYVDDRFFVKRVGLRALYFALAGIMRMFWYLKHGLMAVLFFVGVKMLVSEVYEMPVGIALGVVAFIMSISVLLSIIKSRRERVILEPYEASESENKQGHLPRNEDGI
jgi:tellurite resistance protein TerC